jgi:asparagine synthase (glutamine-hydrolysing)
MPKRSNADAAAVSVIVRVNRGGTPVADASFAEMCGIAGIVGGGHPPADRLAAMGAAMVHRGPDGRGQWNDSVAGFAFRRLAIIDLDERSNQPLHLGSLHLVFNGEIYNYVELREELRRSGHRFVTEGDGEVLIHAWAQWGERTLEHIDGMFALAVWDEKPQQLTLASDPFGEKPLYWRRDRDRIVFASTIGAILSASPAASIDEEVLAAYVALGRLPDPDRSFVVGIHRLRAAHLLRWQAGEIQVKRYWQPNPAAVPESDEAAALHLRGLLSDSVRLRMRSDVPVGTSLSGGVDSSAIVGLSAAIAGVNKPHAFTARFPDFERDEWAYATATAVAAGVAEHHAVEPTASGLIEDLERLVLDHEEPVLSSSVYAQWCVMRAAARADVVVLLDGQGADEAFAGYDGTVGYAILTDRPVSGLFDSRRRELMRCAAARWAPRALVRRYRQRLGSPYAPAELSAAAAALEPPYEPWFARADPLRRELLLQITATSLPGLLRYADRNSMAHSREVRLPFLDRKLVEFVLGLPASFLYAGNETKRVLRRAIRDVVPGSVLARREKIGYETPQSRWLAQPEARERIGTTLLDRDAREREWLEPTAIEADLRRGHWRDDNAIWRALNAELWLRALASRLERPG